MNPKTISIENPSELTVEGGRVAWNWKIMYLAETDRYYEFHLTEPHIAPHPKGISMQIFKKTMLVYNPYNFTPDHHIEILFEPHSKQVSKTMELGRFKNVRTVIKCVMEGISEILL
jgi:hypothetical protein